MPGAHKTPEGKPSGEMHALGSCLRKLASSRPFPHGELSSPGRKRSHGGRRTTPPHARQFCLAPAQLDKSSLCRRADVTILHIYTMGEPGSAEEPRPMSSGLDLTMAPPTRVSAHPSHHPRPRLSFSRNQQALLQLSSSPCSSLRSHYYSCAVALDITSGGGAPQIQAPFGAQSLCLTISGYTSSIAQYPRR